MVDAGGAHARPGGRGACHHGRRGGPQREPGAELEVRTPGSGGRTGVADRGVPLPRGRSKWNKIEHRCSARSPLAGVVTPSSARGDRGVDRRNDERRRPEGEGEARHESLPRRESRWTRHSGSWFVSTPNPFHGEWNYTSSHGPGRKKSCNTCSRRPPVPAADRVRPVPVGEVPLAQPPLHDRVVYGPRLQLFNRAGRACCRGPPASACPLDACGLEFTSWGTCGLSRTAGSPRYACSRCASSGTALTGECGLSGAVPQFPEPPERLSGGKRLGF